ncbi:hypothetical protein [Agromyces bauzanensis]
MHITASARKHGIADADIKHAFENALRYAEIEYDNEIRMLVIGPAADGTLLELVAVPSDDPQRVIHADRLRPKF